MRHASRVIWGRLAMAREATMTLLRRAGLERERYSCAV